MTRGGIQSIRVASNGLHRLFVSLFIESAAGTVEDHVTGDDEQIAVKVYGLIDAFPFLPQTDKNLLHNLFPFKRIVYIKGSEKALWSPCLNFIISVRIISRKYRTFIKILCKFVGTI